MTENRGPIHPSSIILVLLLGGLVMLFLSISFAYLYVRVTKGTLPVDLPPLFILNIAMLAGAGYILEKARKSLQRGQPESLIRQLWLALALTILFLGLQILGWYSLFQQELFVNHSPGYSYLYALSALHFIHVLGGLPFLLPLIWNLQKKLKTSEEVPVMFARKLKLVTYYWHFIDALWIYLVVFLLINSFIQG